MIIGCIIVDFERNRMCIDCVPHLEAPMKFNFGVLMIKVLVASFAVEFLFPVAGLAAVITVNSAFDTNGSLTDGSCSLREAIIAANSDMAVDGCVAGNGNDTIIIPVGTYSLTIPGVNEDGALSGDLDITGNLTLSGAGSARLLLMREVSTVCFMSTRHVPALP